MKRIVDGNSDTIPLFRVAKKLQTTLMTLMVAQYLNFHPHTTQMVAIGRKMCPLYSCPYKEGSGGYGPKDKLATHVVVKFLWLLLM